MAEAAQGYTDWIDPSKIGPPNWLPLEDAFQQMLAHAGSGELAAADLYAWLRSRNWLSVELRVNADGRKTCRRLTADFYQDIAWLEAVPDADAIDHLEIHYPDRVDPSSLFDWHTSFWGLAIEFARELERLYPAILYPTAPAPTSAPKKKPRKAKQPSRAGRIEEWDWDKAKIVAMEALRLRGSPRNKKNRKKNWKSDSDLIRLISDYFVGSSEDHNTPDERTIRPKASGWIDDYEAGRN
jgi:hypothetical protein